MPRGLFWLCTVTVSVLAILYNITNKPSPADQPSVANTTGSRVVPTLQFVVAVSRHGNRGPLITFPKSLYQRNDSKYWPYGVAEITQKGRVQMYNLGKKFRSMYNGFLEQNYQSENFKALSTPKVRSLQSAEVFLAGLFPPSGSQAWNNQPNWQPIPIFPNLLDHEEVVTPSEPSVCPRFREFQKTSILKADQEHDSSIDDVIGYILPYTGYNEYNKTSKTIDNFPRIFFVMIIWESLLYPADEEFPLPDWSKTIYPEPLTSLVLQSFKTFAVGSDTQIRYLQGELFQEVIGLMEAKVNGTLKPDRKMQYYSGHDLTIIGLQAILGLNIIEVGDVKTGSALIYELHCDPDNGQFYIQVLYIDGSLLDLEPSVIDIPGCEFPCDFNQLMNLTEKYYNITDYKKECQINPTS